MAHFKPAGGGGTPGPSGVFGRVWMSVVGIPRIDTDTGDTMRSISDAVPGDFQLMAPGTWTLGNEGILTYTGTPEIDAMIWVSATPWAGAGGGFSCVWGFGVSFNGDLLGTPVLDGFADLDAALRVAGVVAQDAISGVSYSNMTTSRRLVLNTGDTIQPTVGKAQAIAAQESYLEAFSMLVLF
jgi:hypothetical protein